jgi:hypothetical protein
MSTVFVDTFFPNASPLRWRQAEDGAVELFPIPDHARFSPNRQFTHWHLRLRLAPDVVRRSVTVRFATVMNCWNGRENAAMREEPIVGVFSADGREWHPVQGQRSKQDGFAADFDLPVRGDVIHFASLVPYTEDDLQDLLSRLAGSPDARVSIIGATVEGRPLHMIELGRPDAPQSVLLRTQAHPWETGGSWLVEGLVDRLTDGSAASRSLLDRVRFCIQPLANRDGVHRGMTRFTVTGIDPNRGWGSASPHDPVLAPECATLRNWLAAQHRQGRLPCLAIDLHNDCDGRLHLSHPQTNQGEHAARMSRFESLLRRHTWFREGHTASGFHNSGTFGEGLTEEYGIDALIWELRANHAEGLGRQPMADDWQGMGRDFVTVVSQFLAGAS